MMIKNILRRFKHSCSKLVVDLKYSEVMCDSSSDFKLKNFEQLPVWVLWLSKDESKPKIVEKCHQSITKYIYNRPVIFLGFDNLDEYIKLPEYIYHKYYDGKITTTQFSDIIRLYLLDSYGGTWIDSTVLLTSKIPEYITDSNFFFRVPADSFFYNYHLCSSWFLHSEPNNILIRSAKLSITKYWKERDFQINYFLLHLIIKSLYDISSAIRSSINSIEYIDNILPHKLQSQLSNDFDSSLYNKIISESFCHKLTYKVSSLKGTFFNYILCGDIE